MASGTTRFHAPNYPVFDRVGAESRHETQNDSHPFEPRNSLLIERSRGTHSSECNEGTRTKSSLGWLDGIPLPAALVTPAGEIAAVTQALSDITEAQGAMIGRSLVSLFWPESQVAASELIAMPQLGPFDPARGIHVTLNATGLEYLLRVGSPFGTARGAMRLAVLTPMLTRDNPTGHAGETKRPRSAGSIPAPSMHPEGPLQALAGLPLTAIVIADGRVAAVTQRAATLLGVPAALLEGLELDNLVGAPGSLELFPERNGEAPHWQPRALPALPIRINGAIRACACCVLPFGRPGVGLLLIEGWGGSAIELHDGQARQSTTGYLIAGVAHEINNPLAFIMPNLVELRKDLSARRDAMRAVPLDNWLSQLDEVVDGVTRISGVVQNLRAAREATPDAEPTLVNQVVANTLRLAAVSIPSNTSIRRDLGLVLPAHGNRQRLGQVILNLVFNAAHAIEDAKLSTGTIFVRTWSDTRFTWVEVRDDGPGVPDEHREKIFEPFFTTRTTGSGLGLAVCRAMIRELGGELVLQPTHTIGACFRLRLPIWESEVSAGVEPQLEEGTSKAPKPLRHRILLVDDDPPVRRALRRMLSLHHQVEEAASLNEALEKCRESEFDVLITDLVMSHGGGPALIDRLKQEGSPLAEHVLIVSGMAPDATPLKYPRITKPCRAEELLAAIERVAK